MRLRSGTAVVSCHVERPLDDAVWSAFERLLRRRPAGFVITPFIRPPDESEAGDAERWLERAQIAASLAPLGHHTHWGGASRARPPDDVDAAEKVRSESEWLRAHGLAPQYFCGGGWYWDVPVAETLAACGYVDCSATSFQQSYLAANAARLQLAGSRAHRAALRGNAHGAAGHALARSARAGSAAPSGRARPLPRLGAPGPQAGCRSLVLLAAARPSPASFDDHGARGAGGRGT